MKIKAIIFDLDDTLFDCTNTLVDSARKRAAKAMVKFGLKCSDKEAIFVFDDYGLFPEVKKAVDEYIEAKIFKVLIKIGHPKGIFYPTTQNKILKDYESKRIREIILSVAPYLYTDVIELIIKFIL